MLNLRTITAQTAKLLILLIGLFYMGCSEDLNPIEPPTESDSFSGSHPFIVESHSLSLPSPKNPKGKFVETGEIYSDTMLINGEDNREQMFEAKIKYTASYGEEVELKSKLIFPPNSFTGSRNVTQTFYPDHFEVEIEGNPELNNLIIADVKIKGPDFTGLGAESVEFYYLNEQGQRVTPDFKEIKLNSRNNDQVEVKEALMSNMSYYGFILHGPDWLSLPRLPKELTPCDGNLFFEGVEIDGALGGEIRIEGKYLAVNGSLIEVRTKLKFKPGAFEGTRVITQKINTKYGFTDFQPPMEFDIPAEYDIELWGLDLENMNTDNLNYIYMRADGGFEAIDARRLQVDKRRGKLKAEKVKLPHFSRYGFVK